MVTMTADERRAQARAEFDVFYEQCPNRVFLERLADKWAGLCIVSLTEGEMRSAELARRLAGVSRKMLTQTLRRLERDGLVTRRVEATVPVTVTYALSDTGREFAVVLDALTVFAERNAATIERCRAEYDAAQDG